MGIETHTRGSEIPIKFEDLLQLGLNNATKNCTTTFCPDLTLYSERMEMLDETEWTDCEVSRIRETEIIFYGETTGWVGAEVPTDYRPEGIVERSHRFETTMFIRFENGVEVDVDLSVKDQ